MRKKFTIVFILILALSITACTKDKEGDSNTNNGKPPVEEPDNNEEESEDEQNSPSDTDSDTSEKDSTDKWPEDFLPNAPELDGEIVLVKEEGPNKRFIELRNISHNDAEDYVESIKAAGYTQNSNEQNNPNILKYKGMDSEKNIIVFIWKNEITKVELIRKGN